MRSVRDRLALIAGTAHTTIWSLYMTRLICAGHEPTEWQWGILSAGVAAVLAACYSTPSAYQPRHRSR